MYKLASSTMDLFSVLLAKFQLIQVESTMQFLQCSH